MNCNKIVDSMSEQKPGVQRYDMLKGTIGVIDLTTNSIIKKLLGGGNIDIEVSILDSQVLILKEFCNTFKKEWKDL